MCTQSSYLFWISGTRVVLSSLGLNTSSPRELITHTVIALLAREAPKVLRFCPPGKFKHIIHMAHHLF